MKRLANGSTLKQAAYARKLFNADGPSKKDIALSVGFAPSTANNVTVKIERTEGFQNAMKALALESNNLVMAALHEYKARGLENFSNSELNSAMNAIGSAWERINKQRAPVEDNPEKNPLRKVYMTKVENQTINNITPAAIQAPTPAPIEIKEEIDLDF